MSDPTPPEQGLDEILASIRKIISEDEPTAANRTHASTEPLVLTNRVTLKPTVASSDVNVVEARDSHVRAVEMTETSFHEPPPAAPFKETRILDTAQPPAHAPDHPIIDEATATGAASSLDKLSDVVRGNHTPPPPIHLPPEGRTLEDLARDMLQPMLKAWLDEHLPAIVEARVDEEVERIARRQVR